MSHLIIQSSSDCVSTLSPVCLSVQTGDTIAVDIVIKVEHVQLGRLVESGDFCHKIVVQMLNVLWTLPRLCGIRQDQPC